MSVLRDTLGDDDPSNDVLRQVWILGFAKPSIAQRLLAGTPFLYARTGLGSHAGDKRPAPVLDMSSVGRNTWWKLGRAMVQSEALDPISMPVRLSSRAYGGNETENRNAHIWQTLGVMSSVPQQEPLPYLQAGELKQVESRLALSTRMLGDLVGEDYLPRVSQKLQQADQETRGHNWDLLRQKAEENDLYFEPLQLGDNGPAHALLWAERDAAPPASGFHAHLLGITDPYEGDWCKKWTGYHETWTLDSNGNVAEPGTAGTRQAVMIPVALYSLDHIRAPLLLIDFRRPAKARYLERVHHAVDDVTVGVFQMTRYGNWSFLAGRMAWTLVRSRQGAAVDRSARLRAYAQFGNSLYLDGSLRPELRQELIKRSEGLGVNPFENTIKDEAPLARAQYAALLAYLRDPNGYARKLDAERSAELASELHSRGERVLYQTATIASLGLYHHRENSTPEFLASLSDQRRYESNARFLRQVLASGPEPEVVFNMEDIRRSLDALTEIGRNDAELSGKTEALVRSVLARTSDELTRRRCFECLERLTAKRDAPALVNAGAAVVGGQ